MADPWDAIKDGLGSLGPILIAIPWFKDFFARQTRARLGEVRAAGGMVAFMQELGAVNRRRVENPRLSDLVYTVIGLGLITASFAISLVRVLSGTGIEVSCH